MKYTVKGKEKVQLHANYSSASSPSASASDTSSDFSSSSSVSSGRALPLPFQSLWSAILFISHAKPSILPPSCASSLVLRSIAAITSPSRRSRTCATGSGRVNGPTTENPPSASSISSVLAMLATALFVLLRFSPPHGDVATTVADVSLSLRFSPLANLIIVATDTSKWHLTFIFWHRWHVGVRALSGKTQPLLSPLFRHQSHGGYHPWTSSLAVC